MDATRSIILHELRIGPVWQLRKSEESVLSKQNEQNEQNDLSESGEPGGLGNVSELVKLTPEPLPATDNSLESPSAKASGALTWSELSGQLSACQACSARTTSQAPQLGRGNVHPKVLVVGEFLNRHEHDSNSVYVGEVGELLSNMLRSIGLSLDVDVYACKSVRCFAPTKTFADAENEVCITSCAHFLQKQVDLLQPQLILCLGRKASISLMGMEFAETAKRAQVYDYQGIPLILSLPPETLIAQAKYKREAWKDLCLLRSLLD